MRKEEEKKKIVSYWFRSVCYCSDSFVCWICHMLSLFSRFLTLTYWRIFFAAFGPKRPQFGHRWSEESNFKELIAKTLLGRQTQNLLQYDPPALKYLELSLCKLNEHFSSASFFSSSFLVLRGCQQHWFTCTAADWLALLSSWPDLSQSAFRMQKKKEGEKRSKPH